MYERVDTIAKAHRKTLGGVFEGGISQDVQWSPFADWLKPPSGIYWISGKAGSGKSTLMRYITQDPRTVAVLQSWANRPVMDASYFFWKSGAPDQASLIGLYCALLYQILSQEHHLIESIFSPELKR
ncbi:hypothetical protein WAI453_005449 [Rhynchosporium graminicola]